MSMNIHPFLSSSIHPSVYPSIHPSFVVYAHCRPLHHLHHRFVWIISVRSSSAKEYNLFGNSTFLRHTSILTHFYSSRSLTIVVDLLIHRRRSCFYESGLSCHFPSIEISPPVGVAIPTICFEKCTPSSSWSVLYVDQSPFSAITALALHPLVLVYSWNRVLSTFLIYRLAYFFLTPTIESQIKLCLTHVLCSCLCCCAARYTLPC